MTKPGDPGDATQPLSESQVVAVTPNPPPIATNDQSIAWKGTVVSADEFAPAAKRPSRSKWLAAGALGAVAIGGAAFALWPRGAPPPTVAPIVQPASSAGSGSAIAPSSIPPLDAAVPVDAAAALIEPDAAVKQAVTPPKPATPKKKKPRPHGH